MQNLTIVALALTACARSLTIEPADYVVPVDVSAFDQPLPADANALQMRRILANANRYALTTWYASLDVPRITTFDEWGVRPIASEAFALAVALRTNAYDEDSVGVPAWIAEASAHCLVVDLANTHLATLEDGWGDHWQSALWAAYAGTAGWLLWDSLSPADARAVARMVEAEAMRFVDYVVPFYRDARGVLITPGDSKAEENAWNAQLLYLAVNMMPRHPMRAAWEAKAAELAISSYARPAQVLSTEIVNGREMSMWLAGSNANTDGAVINHGIVHPDYIATAAYTGSAPLWYGLARAPTPDAMFVGVEAAYATLTDARWEIDADYTDTSCLLTTCECSFLLHCVAAAPGGTIYVPGDDAIYFPHGNDWGEGRRMNYAMFDAIADAFGVDGDSSTSASAWEALHARAVLVGQERSSDRRAYVAAGEDLYPDREEWVAVHAAMSWLAKYVVAQGAFSRTDVAL